jgi:cytidine deaminase
MQPTSLLINRRVLLAALGSGLALCGLGSEAITRIAPQAEVPSADLNPQSRKLLEEAVHSPAFAGQIPATMVRELAKSEATSVSGVMIRLLALARTYSHAPISNYHVGAVARGLSGSLYLGMNVEIPQHSLGFSVHGEQSALSNAYMHAESGIAALAVTAAPCGHCRQFMIEMSSEGEMEILVKGKSPMKLSALLPMAFGPRDLGFQHGAFPVKTTTLASPNGSENEFARAALDAAAHAYAPYSGAVSGVAIQAKSGRVYKGSYLENAAFNPSLSPLQTALVQLILAGEDYADIAHVLLMELKNAKISQASVTRAALSAVAPGAQLQTINLDQS